jgi:hypothetical protein
MSLFEIFPPEMLVADAKEDVILLLKAMPIDERRKKQVYVDWTKLTGAVLEEEDIKKILGEEAHRRLLG